MEKLDYIGITIKLKNGEVIKHKISSEEFVEGAWMGGRNTVLVSDQYELPWINSISLRTNLPV